jgi:hypothetical protein
MITVVLVYAARSAAQTMIGIPTARWASFGTITLPTSVNKIDEVGATFNDSLWIFSCAPMSYGTTNVWHSLLGVPAVLRTVPLYANVETAGGWLQAAFSTCIQWNVATPQLRPSTLELSVFPSITVSAATGFPLSARGSVSVLARSWLSHYVSVAAMVSSVTIFSAERSALPLRLASSPYVRLGARYALPTWYIACDVVSTPEGSALLSAGMFIADGVSVVAAVNSSPAAAYFELSCQTSLTTTLLLSITSVARTSLVPQCTIVWAP